MSSVSKQDAIKYLERKASPGWDACSDSLTISLAEVKYLIDKIYSQNEIDNRGGVMVKILEQANGAESKRLKIPTSIRPYDVGYRVVSEKDNILTLRNGASVFSLPSEAKKSIQREFRKDDPDFDIEKYRVEEVAIINFEKLKNFLQEVE